jgi:ABC-type transport system involved in multi-copper enzyme maturation permease subunit
LQRPSRWLSLLWGLYVVGAVIFTALAIAEFASRGARGSPWAGPFNGFQAAVGLLLLSLLTPAALAEDRARGGLDLLLATPISTRELVLSKWWAYYRIVPALALLPTVIAVAHAVPQQRWLGVVLMLAFVLSYGAAVTSLGLALATWVPRVDRALVLSAAVSVLVTVAVVPLAFFLFKDQRLGLAMASASPLLGVGVLTSVMATASPGDWPRYVAAALFWSLVYVGLALGLLSATIASFDRCLGRITPGAARAERRRTSLYGARTFQAPERESPDKHGASPTSILSRSLM